MEVRESAVSWALQEYDATVQSLHAHKFVQGAPTLALLRLLKFELHRLEQKEW